MSPIIYKWILIIICASIFVLSDTLSAYWGRTSYEPSLILMTFLAPVGYFLFALINKNSNLAVSSGLVNMMLIIGTIMVSIFYFKDSLTIRQSFGLVLAITAVGLMI